MRVPASIHPHPEFPGSRGPNRVFLRLSLQSQALCEPKSQLPITTMASRLTIARGNMPCTTRRRLPRPYFRAATVLTLSRRFPSSWRPSTSTNVFGAPEHDSTTRFYQFMGKWLLRALLACGIYATGHELGHRCERRTAISRAISFMEQDQFERERNPSYRDLMARVEMYANVLVFPHPVYPSLDSEDRFWTQDDRLRTLRERLLRRRIQKPDASRSQGVEVLELED